MAKNFVVFGATGAQGGSVALELLKARSKYNVLAVTRNLQSEKAKKLAAAGAILIQADMEDLDSLKDVIKGAHFLFIVTDFLGAGGNSKRESKQGLNLIEAASASCDTLEAIVWSSLPDARKQPFPYSNIVHFNSKRDISDRLRESPLKHLVTEVWLAAYYENIVNSFGIYEPQKQLDGSYVLNYPIDEKSSIPFMSVTDLGKLLTVIVEDPIKYRTKVVSFVSERKTPLEILESFKSATGVEAKFQSMTTEQFKQHLETSLKFPSNVALSMSENLSCYRTNPNMITDYTDYNAKDVLQGLKTWDDFVRDEDWKSYLASKQLDTLQGHVVQKKPNMAARAASCEATVCPEACVRKLEDGHEILNNLESREILPR